MPTSPPEDVKAKVLLALAESDARRRDARAERIVWISEYRPNFAWVLGSVEAMTLLGEAKDCYVDGHFMATVMLATAFIEHTLSNRLQNRGITTKSRSFAESIRLAREHSLYESALLDRTDHLREIRNPFAHRRPPEDVHTLGNRYLAEKKHPDLVLDADAQESLKVMYEFLSRAKTQD